MMKKRKPCPFCGCNKSFLSDFDDHWYRVCSDCNASTIGKTKKEASRKWDARAKAGHGIAIKYRLGEYLPNLWLGVTAENQEMADKRIPTLLNIPAAVRFVSLEPLLGPIDFKKIYGHDMMCCVQCGYVGDEPYETDYETPDDPEGWPICPKCGETNCGGYNSFDKIGVTPLEMRPFPKIDWVIVGCESLGGKVGRECKIEWVKRIVEQCTEEDVPVFVKQLPINGKVSKNMAEWPERLRRRETPRKAGE